MAQYVMKFVDQVPPSQLIKFPNLII